MRTFSSIKTIYFYCVTYDGRGEFISINKKSTRFITDGLIMIVFTIIPYLRTRFLCHDVYHACHQEGSQYIKFRFHNRLCFLCEY